MEIQTATMRGARGAEPVQGGTHLGPGAAHDPAMQREPGLGHPQRVLVWAGLEGTGASCAFSSVLCAHRLPAALTGCPGCGVHA